jgi:hypothetical protein
VPRGVGLLGLTHDAGRDVADRPLTPNTTPTQNIWPGATQAYGSGATDTNVALGTAG